MNNKMRHDLSLAEQALDEREVELDEILIHANDAINEADRDRAEGYPMPSWVEPLRNIVGRIQQRKAEEGEKA